MGRAFPAHRGGDVLALVVGVRICMAWGLFAQADQAQAQLNATALA